ncbi:MAG: PAS domain-containing protein [Betaproteobacteria bacterium]|nr:PAS domain-containing protein [Betaproteobacteria bacterium]
MRLIALTAAILIAAPALARPPAPVAVAGVLDLRDWSFARDGVAGLAGEWDFAWGRFEDPDSAEAAGPARGRIRVPAPWNEASVPGKPRGAEGYATYRLRVECRETARLALVLPIQHSAVRLYVNGRVVALQGSPGDSHELARPAFVQQVAPLEEAACPLRIVAHVSNYDMRNGGLLRNLELGTERQLMERRERGLARDLFALGGIAVLSLLPVLVFLWRREDRAPLWLGLYGLAQAAFVGLGGERVFQPLIAPLGWQAAWKIAILCLLAGVTAFPAFLRAFYPEAFPRALFRVLLVVSGALALLVLATPTRVFTEATPLLYALSAAVGLVAVAVPVRAALQGRRSAWLLLAGTAALIVTGLHDTVQIPYQIADKLTPYGLLVFALAPVLLLAQRFARALRAEELRSVEQQQRVDLLVNATKAGLLDTDMAAKRTTYSERLKDMLGYPPDADSSRWPPFIELTHPDDRERIRASFVAQMRDLSMKSGVRRWSDSPDFRVRRADGSYVWIHGEAISITGAGGRTLRHISSFVDISERKRQELELAGRIEYINALLAELRRGEEALRQSDARYDVALRAINEGVYDWNVADGTIFYSDGVYRVLGMPESMKTPEDWSNWIHPDDRAKYNAGIAAHFKGNTDRFECDYRYRRGDGSWRWARQHGIAIRNEQGRALRMIGSTGDITELKATEHALARERERLALLVRATKAGFMDWDAVADTCVYSERFKEMLGHPPDADTSAWPALFDMMHPADRGPMRDAFRGMLRQGAATGERLHGPLEYRLRKTDGSYLWVRGESIAQIGADGRTERFLTSYIDITPLREMNLALEESVRLREEVDRIGRHDLKTPLNSIIGIPRLLRDSGRLSAEDAELLAFVEQAGYRLLNMVNLSLDMFRMERGSYTFTPRTVDLYNVLGKVARDLATHARSKRVEVRIEGPHLHALAEELLCFSMFANLVKNAVEASPEGGAVSLTLTGDEAGVTVGVHNAGAVPQAVRARFFDKYSTSGKQSGSGLGTYSARLMARTQQGEIEMETSETAGTTLRVRLKAAPGIAMQPDTVDVAEQAKEQEPSAPPRPLSVLVVDDDEYTRIFVQRSLPSSLRTSSAVNGRDALESVKRAPPDVIVMDLDMPVMGGLEAAALIRQWEAQSSRGRCAMIAMSSNDGPEFAARSAQAGFDRYLTKPVSPDAIWRAIAELARSLPPALGPRPEQPVRVEENLRGALPGFLASRRALLDELGEALAQGNAEGVPALAHKLAGSFALYGFHWAAAQGKMIERRAGAKALDGLAGEVAALRRHLDTVRVECGDQVLTEAPQ